MHAPQKHAISWHAGKSRGYERKDRASPALLHVPQKAKGGTESAAAGLRAAAARIDHAAGAVRWPRTLDLRSADVDATDQLIGLGSHASSQSTDMIDGGASACHGCANRSVSVYYDCLRGGLEGAPRSERAYQLSHQRAMFVPLRDC